MAVPAARPADRYGDRARGRWWPLLLAAAGIVLAVAVGWLLVRAAIDPVRSSLVRWEQPADGAMTATIEVVRPPGEVVTCDLIAIDIRRVIVGQTTVVIPAGDERRTRVRAEIPLQGDAVAPELRTCTATGAG